MKYLRFTFCLRKLAWIVTVACIAFSAQAQETKKPLSGDQRQMPFSGVEDVKKKYPNLQSSPFGKGIFAHVRGINGKLKASKEEIANWAQNRYIAGTQLTYTWAELEPREGEYRWDIIERDLEPWAQAGKKCWIEIGTASRRDFVGDRVTPGWLFGKRVPKIQGESTAGYPVFWHPRYLELWGNFIRALAKKFDGDPRLEFVSASGYSQGVEPNLSARRDNAALMEQWKKAGFDGFTPSGVYLNKAVKPILTIFADTFRKTRVAVSIHVRSDFDWAMNEFAADMNFILLSNGMNVRVAGARSRQAWRERREKLDAKVGYAEWAPPGRETDQNKFREMKKRRKAVNERRDSANLGGRKDQSTMAQLIDVYRDVIGDDNDPRLRPWSRLSYLPLGRRISEVETDEEWMAALKWAWDHLEG